MPTPKTGGIVSFTIKKLQCMNCKTPLKEGGNIIDYNKKDYFIKRIYNMFTM